MFLSYISLLESKKIWKKKKNTISLINYLLSFIRLDWSFNHVHFLPFQFYDDDFYLRLGAFFVMASRPSLFLAFCLCVKLRHYAADFLCSLSVVSWRTTGAAFTGSTKKKNKKKLSLSSEQLPVIMCVWVRPQLFPPYIWTPSQIVFFTQR